MLSPILLPLREFAAFLLPPLLRRVEALELLEFIDELYDMVLLFMTLRMTLELEEYTDWLSLYLL